MDEKLTQALCALENYIKTLCDAAGKDASFAHDLWVRLSKSPGLLREFAYFHDYQSFLGEYKVAGYSLPDVLVWQVDHFKAYMDRHDEMNRYRRERLLLESLDTMLKMEQDPETYVNKIQNETGTDFEGHF